VRHHPDYWQETQFVRFLVAHEVTRNFLLQFFIRLGFILKIDFLPVLEAVVDQDVTLVERLALQILWLDLDGQPLDAKVTGVVDGIHVQSTQHLVAEDERVQHVAQGHAQVRLFLLVLVDDQFLGPVPVPLLLERDGGQSGHLVDVLQLIFEEHRHLHPERTGLLLDLDEVLKGVVEVGLEAGGGAR